MKFASIALFLLATACTTIPVDAPESLQKDKDYQSVVEKHTRFYRRYDGFYEAYRAHATELTPECRMAMLDQKSHYLQWPDKKYREERERAQQEMSTATEFFLQFYAPQDEYDDLAKDNSIWKVYLELNGHKYEGKVHKVKGKPIEFQVLYPDYDKFSTPYRVTFEISTQDAIRYPAKLVMASTLGDATFSFEAGN